MGRSMKVIIEICSVETCNRPRHIRGLCGAHYARIRRNGRLDISKPVVNRWSDKEVSVLINYYTHTDSDNFYIPDIADILGRSNDAISIKAGKLGLSDKKRTHSLRAKEKMSMIQKNHHTIPEKRKRMSIVMKNRIREKGHNRGMLGKHHSDRTKKILSIKSKESAKNRSEEERSSSIMKGLKTREKNGTLNPMRDKTSWKAGWREIGGYKKYYRSRWEANYARYLQWLKELGEIKDWLHEPDTFWFEGIMRGVRSYLPDFKITENGGGILYHEVKGWMDDKSKTKIKRMKKYHPRVRLIVIATKEYMELEKKVGAVISGWEFKKRKRRLSRFPTGRIK